MSPCSDAKALRDDDDGRSALPHLLNCLPHRFPAIGVKAGVRLVQYEQPGVAEEGPGQTEPLPQSPGQAHAAIADLVSFPWEAA